jgi:hypothetical protein
VSSLAWRRQRFHNLPIYHFNNSTIQYNIIYSIYRMSLKWKERKPQLQIFIIWHSKMRYFDKNSSLCKIRASHGGESVYTDLCVVIPCELVDISQSWRWRQCVPPKLWYIPAGPHVVTTQRSISTLSSPLMFCYIVMSNSFREPHIQHFHQRNLTSADVLCSLCQEYRGNFGTS